MRALRRVKWMTRLTIAVFLLLSQADAQETVPAGVVFEKNIEYSNPDEQHLQLNMARPQGNRTFKWPEKLTESS